MSDDNEVLWAVMKAVPGKDIYPARVFRTREAARAYIEVKRGKPGTALYTIERTKWGPEQ